MELFDRFLQERLYLKGVSKSTLRYYRWVRGAFLPILNEPTKAGMMDCIQALLSRGVSPTSVNTYLRGLKAYCIWLHGEGVLKEKLKVQFLKTEQKVLATLSSTDISQLLRYQTTGTNLKRAQMISFLILDCGLRISETLALRKEDIDLENLTVKVVGKGGKHRLIPVSKELRGRLFRYISHNEQQYLFPTRSGGKVSVRNIERDFKALFKKAGIEGIRASPHTLRHSFAVCYLRNGGNLEFLRRILGHSSLVTTQKYLKSLGVDDLKACHSSLSPLAVRR